MMDNEPWAIHLVRHVTKTLGLLEQWAVPHRLQGGPTLCQGCKYFFQLNGHISCLSLFWSNKQKQKCRTYKKKQTNNESKIAKKINTSKHLAPKNKISTCRCRTRIKIHDNVMIYLMEVLILFSVKIIFNLKNVQTICQTTVRISSDHS